MTILQQYIITSNTHPDIIILILVCPGSPCLIFQPCPVSHLKCDMMNWGGRVPVLSLSMVLTDSLCLSHTLPISRLCPGADLVTLSLSLQQNHWH